MKTLGSLAPLSTHGQPVSMIQNGLDCGTQDVAVAAVQRRIVEPLAFERRLGNQPRRELPVAVHADPIGAVQAVVAELAFRMQIRNPDLAARHARSIDDTPNFPQIPAERALAEVIRTASASPDALSTA